MAEVVQALERHGELDLPEEVRVIALPLEEGSGDARGGPSSLP